MNKSRVVFMLLAASCWLLAIGCNQDDYHTMLRSAAGISDGLSQLQQTNEASFRAGLLSGTETIAIASGVSNAVHANDIFIAALKNAKGATAANKSALLLDFGQVVVSIQALNPEVLHIKNPDARAKFEAALQLVVLASNTIAAILQQQQPAQAVPANNWRTRVSAKPELYAEGGARGRSRYGAALNSEGENNGSNADYFSDHDRRAAHPEGDPDEAGVATGRRAVTAARLGYRRGDARCGAVVDREGEGRSSSS